MMLDKRPSPIDIMLGYKDSRLYNSEKENNGLIVKGEKLIEIWEKFFISYMWPIDAR